MQQVAGSRGGAGAASPEGGAGRQADPSRRRGLAQRGFRRLRRSLRGGLLRLLSPLAPRGDAPPPDLREAKRVLLVLVNFRLGNTLLATPAVNAVVRAFPGAEIAFLGGPAAPAVLQGFKLARIHVVRRSHAWLPHRMAALLREIRAARYDVAIHLGGSAISLGAQLTGWSGAPQRVGCRGRSGSLFFTTAREPSAARHKLDALGDLLSALGVGPLGERCLALSDDERADAARWLAAHFGSGHAAPVAFFAGGRDYKGKSWSRDALAAVAARLRERGIPVLLILGPEERAEAPALVAAFAGAGILADAPLRQVAASCAACRAVVSPDSGPMHLAVASGAPTVALFRKPNHDRWGPRPPHRIVVDPEGRAVEPVLEAIEAVARRA
jgi:ADP-heptose:LPS heptosyltransferase